MRPSGWATARSEILPNRSPDTTYEAKLRTCNDTQSCTVGTWSADHRFITEPEVTTRPPGRVRNLTFDSRGDQTITVDWDRPTNSGSAALASYPVQHRV